ADSGGGRNGSVRGMISSELGATLSRSRRSRPPYRPRGADGAGNDDACGRLRLLRADRDVAAGAYPMKRFNWPTEGLPGGLTERQFEDRYTDYPFNPIAHGAGPVSSYADADGFVEVAEAPTGFTVIKRQVFKLMMEKYPDLNYVPDGPPNNPQPHLY